MGFSINTNTDALKGYNALGKTTASLATAQLRIATQKKINTVADNTSGYNVGKKLEAQNSVMNAQLGNITDAKNYLSTAESALQQINDKLNQIQAKQTDAKDPLKDSAAIADDIRTLANEIDSILKSTNINGSNLLSSSDGATALSAPTYDVGGSSLTFDFASSDLNVSSLHTAAVTNLQSATDATVLGSDVTAVAGNVRAALGKIGNLSQSLSSREEYLTQAVTNNESTLASIFDADPVEEQMNVAKQTIAYNTGVSMLSQMNSNSQYLLKLFQ